MVASPEATPATTPDSIQGLYAHFIGGQRVQPDGSPDLVRNNPSAADQVLGGLRSADLELVHTAVRLLPRPGQSGATHPRPPAGGCCSKSRGSWTSIARSWRG